MNWAASSVPDMLNAENKVMTGEPSTVSLEETWMAMEGLVEVVAHETAPDKPCSLT